MNVNNTERDLEGPILTLGGAIRKINPDCDFLRLYAKELISKSQEFLPTLAVRVEQYRTKPAAVRYTRENHHYPFANFSTSLLITNIDGSVACLQRYLKPLVKIFAFMFVISGDEQQ